jgi:hypothetical protein
MHGLLYVLRKWHAEAKQLRSEAEQMRVDFLQVELASCFTLASVAETEYTTGHHEMAERSLHDAEQGYRSLFPFLSSPKHLKGIKDEERRELVSAREQLRLKLDELRQLIFRNRDTDSGTAV